MPRHVIVDGSNIATEGRTMPSLKQLSEAVTAFMEEFPNDVITVVVDATFGHRIDTKEVAEFDAAVAHNELVAPPAGAIGRGDAFVLSIANKTKGSILSNDSYQEFHGEYAWLFDEGRLIGGKPVPNVGWVFVLRTPVRGPTSRKSVRDSRKPKGKAVGRPSAAASQPMPVPTAPPPGAVLAAAGAAGAGASASNDRGGRSKAKTGDGQQPPREASKEGPLNDLVTFIGFVEHHPVGSSVNAVVESYSSHGAYVSIGDVRGYVPLRLMSDPPARTARELGRVGDAVTLVVHSFTPARRSIDLAVPAAAAKAGVHVPHVPVESAAVEAAAIAEVAGTAAELDAVAKPGRRGRGKRAAELPALTEQTTLVVDAAAVEPQPMEAAAPKRGRRRTQQAAQPVAEPVAENAVVEASSAPVGKPPRRRSAKVVSAAEAPAATASDGAQQPAEPVPPTPPAPKKSSRAAKKSAAQAPATADQNAAEGVVDATPAKRAAKRPSARKEAAAKRAPAKTPPPPAAETSDDAPPPGKPARKPRAKKAPPAAGS